MDRNERIEYERIATKGRMLGLSAVYGCQSGHIGGAFSVMEILTVLYFKEMNISPEHPGYEDRDRLVLSKGHCTAALYPVLAMRGYFPEEHLKTFRHVDSNLSGHAEMNGIPGVDMSTGSLGQGLSAAVGMALSAKADKKKYRVYAVMGDGEIQEGQIWEAAMAASKYKLDNLTGIVDVNGLQIDGPTDEVMPLEPLEDKWKAFGWEVLQIDGNDVAQISQALKMARDITGKPVMILAHTVKGKGVSFMENQVSWHGHAPSKAEYEAAKGELEARLQMLEEV